jgi:hypothetical protein
MKINCMKAVPWLKAVSCHHLTMETQVCTRLSPYGTCGGQSGAGTGIYPSYSVFVRQYHSTMALHAHGG